MFPSYGTITPFANWEVTKPSQSLVWYNAYNQTKHGGTLWALAEWWLANHATELASGNRSRSLLTKHLAGTELARQKLTTIRPSAIDEWLRSRDAELSARSINHLRCHLVRIFNRAKEAERFLGDNPAARTRSRKVPKRLPDYLRPHEVPQVFEALSPHHLPLFAAAVYTGMRKGELLALRKADIDLERRQIIVARSNDRDTTKGGHADAIPMAKELVPFIEEAMKRSPSELVFPDGEGKQQREDVDLREVLRRALGRAGIVERYEHRCRRKTCRLIEVHQDEKQRRCPKCNFVLWPVAIVRKIRFHDLRHTTASLLLMNGASIAAVQRILRHSDPKMTTEIYGHLSPDFMHTEIDKLSFYPEKTAQEEQQKAVVNLPLTTRSLPANENASLAVADAIRKSEAAKGVGRIGAIGFEPTAFWSQKAARPSHRFS